MRKLIMVLALLVLVLCAHAQPQEAVTPNFFAGVSDPGNCQPNLTTPAPIFFYRQDETKLSMCAVDGTLAQIYPPPSPNFTSRTVTSSGSVAPTDALLLCAPAGPFLAVTMTLPAATGSGRLIQMTKSGSNASCKFAPAGTDLIGYANANLTLSYQYQYVGLIDGAAGAWTLQNPLGGDIQLSHNSYTVTNLNGHSFSYYVPTVYACGSTSACALSAINVVLMAFGSAPLVSGTPSAVTITGLTFTSATSYACSLTPQSAVTSLSIANVDGTSFTITGPNTSTAVINYVCAGN